MLDGPRYKILLADDDPGVRQTLEMVLASAGYDVSTAEHGIDAIFLLQKSIPDLVIYDLNMPEVPGYDLLAVIRIRFPQVGVIAMSSAYSQKGNLPDSVFADAVYIKGQSKPEELLDEVAELLKTADARRIEHQQNGGTAFRANQRARRASGR